MKITIEAVFLYGIISAKATTVALKHVNEDASTPVPAVKFLFKEVCNCFSDFQDEQIVQTLYELMALNMIQCSFVSGGFYAMASFMGGEVFTLTAKALLLTPQQARSCHGSIIFAVEHNHGKNQNYQA